LLLFSVKTAVMGSNGTKIKMISENLNVVVGAYTHALLAKHPRTRYTVGPMNKILLLISMLPDWLSDKIVVSISPYPIPDTVKL